MKEICGIITWRYAVENTTEIRRVRVRKSTKEQRERKRGVRSEVIAMQTARMLVGTLPIVSVSKTPSYLDMVGVDILVGLRICDTIIQVPLQIKSSKRKAKQYRKKYPSYISRYGLVLLVVKKGCAVHELRDELHEALCYVIENSITYDEFYRMLETKMRQTDAANDAVFPKNEVRCMPSRKKEKFMRPSVASARC